MHDNRYDAVIVGAGPNGLAAAVRLAQRGLSVRLIEANETIGGGARSAELTRPGFVHDVCSAIHPMAAGSPYFRSLELDRFGLQWIHSPKVLAHPLDGGRAVTMVRSLEETLQGLGVDGSSYRRMVEPLVAEWDALSREFMGPIIHLPRRPVLLARFGVYALQSAAGLARRSFKGQEARALFAGLAAHSLLPLEALSSSAIALMLAGAGHAVGWPMPRGGAQAISDALGGLLQELGGEIETGHRVVSLEELPSARAVVLDLTVRQFLQLAGDRMPSLYRRRLERFKYGPAVFKVDYALHEPVPWEAVECTKAGTVHVGGTIDEVAESEAAVGEGKHPERPFVLAAEHSRFDDTRAPEGRHTLWAYCHVPHGSTRDMTDRIERQIERFAPGFRDCVMERHVTNSAALERRNANMIGGDIVGGRASLLQLVSRPVPTPVPYRTPVENVYLCSASTPPSGGVHGMCGYHAAETVLSDLFS